MVYNHQKAETFENRLLKVSRMNPLRRILWIIGPESRQFRGVMKGRTHVDDLRLGSALRSGDELRVLEALVMHHDTEIVELGDGQAAIFNREDGQMAVLADESKRDWLPKYGSLVLQSIATYGPSDNRHLSARLEMSEKIVELTCFLLREAGELKPSATGRIRSI
jgi:hypothetical protein